MTEATIERRKSKVVKIGSLKIGGSHPISVQSMTSCDIKDKIKTNKQIEELEKVGCDLIRVAIPDIESANLIPNLKESTNIPIMADIHFSYEIAIEAIKNNVDGIRINPGNIKKTTHMINIINEAKKRNVLIRFGINAGSLNKKLIEKYGKPNYKAMVDETNQVISILKKIKYHNIILSIKSSNVVDTIKANEIIAENTDYPLHIGITESGFDRKGIVKSATGIGILLYQGIGDTIRVSLSGNPEQEVLVGYDILRTLEIRKRGVNIIACPTCGRCKVDIHIIGKEIEENLRNIKHPLTVAIMGCVVNGPGEAKVADVGIAFNKEEAMIYKKGKFIGRCRQEDSVEKLTNEIRLMLENKETLK